ncbi:M48 family metalloprotease [Parvibaculum sp.]|uniref:M48 family metalloprotease n=1 Tax=Parvibaculum sp. TaxID=2024848 RepID=UPI00320E1D06
MTDESASRVIEALRRLRRVSISVALVAALAGCTTNPATGKVQLAPLMSAEDEAREGAEAHPKIIEAYGGVYDDPRLGAYVAGVTARIAKGAGSNGTTYRVTILNSPIVNAFALPGGYVYVTRGLLALVDDEAELAGVIGHEIGHVIARHGAQRQTAALGASVVGAVLGAVVGSSAVGQAAGLGGQGLLADYSRDQEYEADALGVRYLAQAGYDPQAEADFLEAMAGEQALNDRIQHRKRDQRSSDWLASHPATPDRVKAAREHAGETGVAAGAGERNRDALFTAVDGLIYGDAPEQGMVRGRRFVHPGLRIGFTAPPNYVLTNAMKAVIAQGPDETIVKFDMAKKGPAVEIGTYMSSEWASGVDLSKIDRYTLNGMKAAEAKARSGKYNVRLVAVEAAPDTVYRFLMGVPPAAGTRQDGALRELVQSFHRLSEAEVLAAKPLRLRIVTVALNETAETLGTRMALSDFRTERFRALNGLRAGGEPRPGAKVKIVSE